MAWFRINDAKASLMRPQAGASVSPSRWDKRFLNVSPPSLSFRRTFNAAAWIV